jgi:hypothetical protein
LFLTRKTSHKDRNGKALRRDAACKSGGSTHHGMTGDETFVSGVLFLAV